MSELRHFDNLGTARFITFSTFRRRQVLRAEEICVALAQEIDRMRRDHGVFLLGYVFMPDHVHLVLHPPGALALGRLIGQVKARSARAIARDSRVVGALVQNDKFLSARLWQLRCYDHNCRSPVATRDKIDYCHKNPVAKGLVSEPGEWRWSSYNWYQGDSDVPLKVDSIETVL